MRGSGWLLPIAGAILCLLAGIWPLMALLSEARLSIEGETPAVFAVLVRTSGYAVVVAIAATLIGWIPGRLLGAAITRRGSWIVAAALLVPVCLPAYLVYYAWWQSWPADSAIYRFAVEHGGLQLMRQATVVLGLICWSWPIASWCVSASSSRRSLRIDEQLQIDGAPVVRRTLERARNDVPGLVLGAALIFLLVFNNTVCFDLANIYSFGFTLRAVEAEGASTADLLRTASPAMLVSVVGVLVLWPMLTRHRDVPTRAQKIRPVHVGATVAIWLATVAFPLAIFLPRLEGKWMGQFLAGYDEHLRHGLALAAATAALGVVVGAGLVALWMDGRRSARFVAHLQSIIWLVLAIVPGPLVAVALEAGYNRPWRLWPIGKNAEDALGTGSGVSEVTLADVIYESPLILALGHLSRFALVPVLLARWVAAAEPPALRDRRLLEGRLSLGPWVRANRPALTALVLASAGVMFVFSLGEIPVTARLSPPAFESLASSLLNFMHYQQVRSVMCAVIVFLAGGLLAAILLAAGVLTWRAGRSAAMMLLLGSFLLSAGCSTETDEYGVALLPARLSFGAAGLGMGQFNYPRGIALDPQREAIYIVDKAARIQRFDLDGQPVLQWRMPEWENGKPTGLSVSPDGRVFVADTHYHRIMVYDADGKELFRFGEYGEGPGQFIYPTDVAFGPNGHIYVTEYGGNDRIQVFSEDGEHLFMFGEFGEEDGQFNRPQSIAFNADQTELFITDAVNHRIVVTDPQGELLRSFGQFGRQVGFLAYPYGLELLDDGTLLICEFGNNRIQRFTPQGESLGAWGGVGTEEGRLQYPWGLAGKGDRVYVVDSGNNRVQMIRGL